jgi:hypothetical protein
MVGAQPHRLFARLNSDGSVDGTFNCQIGGDVQLRLDGLAVQPQPSGKIVLHDDVPRPEHLGCQKLRQVAIHLAAIRSRTADQVVHVAVQHELRRLAAQIAAAKLFGPRRQRPGLAFGHTHTLPRIADRPW